MTKVVIRTDDVDGFFARAKVAARRADRGQPFDGRITLAFEDPQRMFTVLSEEQSRTRHPKGCALDRAEN
jgi:hypothetical protein